MMCVCTYIRGRCAACARARVCVCVCVCTKDRHVHTPQCGKGMHMFVSVSRAVTALSPITKLKFLLLVVHFLNHLGVDCIVLTSLSLEIGTFVPFVEELMPDMQSIGRKQFTFAHCMYVRTYIRVYVHLCS